MVHICVQTASVLDNFKFMWTGSCKKAIKQSYQTKTTYLPGELNKVGSFKKASLTPTFINYWCDCVQWISKVHYKTWKANRPLQDLRGSDKMQTTRQKHGYRMKLKRIVGKLIWLWGCCRLGQLENMTERLKNKRLRHKIGGGMIYVKLKNEQIQKLYS